MDLNYKRFIEDSFPVKAVSREGSREKNNRFGYISTLHIWWARRPLATSRATAYASLIPVPDSDEEKKKVKQFIAELSKWENSNNPKLIIKAKKEILIANGNVAPKVLDPFAGGGSIPLETLRLGCETYASDYNPVAVLIEKCTIEYPQKFGKPIKTKIKKKYLGKYIEEEEETNPLLENVKYWSNWVFEKARTELENFYPIEPDGSIPIAYIWARTINCQNPSCKINIPLFKKYWLSTKHNNKVALFPYVEDNVVKYKIVGTEYESIPTDFNPEKGTVSHAIVNCPKCGHVIPEENTKHLFKNNKSGERLIAVISKNKKNKGKKYRIAVENDIVVFEKAKNKLNQILEKQIMDGNQEILPNENINYIGNSIEELYSTRCIKYGLVKWKDLFNQRQSLNLLIFCEKIREVGEMLSKDKYESDFVKAILSYLALALDRLADYGSSLCVLNPTGGRGVVHVFGRHAIPMVWDYAESNPFLEEGAGWTTASIKNIEWIKHASKIDNNLISISQCSATSLSFQDNSFDAVFTDPPYYDNINYAEISDFFYVWLKRCIGDLFPEYFSTPLVPKSQEIVANPVRQGGKEKSKHFFENNIKVSIKEIYRILKPSGIAIIVYAHKTTSGWSTMINALLDSGLVVTASYPLDTEKEGRLIAQESAALASSIYIIARKIKKEGVGFYNNVKEELKIYLHSKLDNLWTEGIAGPDFFISSIGFGIVVFGKYEKVIDYEGNIKRADVLLDDIREIVTEYTVKHILQNGFSVGITELTRFYVMWKFIYGDSKVEFDEANKLAHSVGIDLAEEWNKNGFIKKEKEFIRVLGPTLRDLKELQDSLEMIDVMHLVLLLWEQNKRKEMLKVLSDTGFGSNEIFFRVGQAISESLGKLTPDSKEKKLLDGFLSGKEKIKETISGLIKDEGETFKLEFE